MRLSFLSSKTLTRNLSSFRRISRNLQQLQMGTSSPPLQRRQCLLTPQNFHFLWLESQPISSHSMGQEPFIHFPSTEFKEVHVRMERSKTTQWSLISPELCHPTAAAGNITIYLGKKLPSMQGGTKWTHSIKLTKQMELNSPRLSKRRACLLSLRPHLAKCRQRSWRVRGRRRINARKR